MQAQLKTPTVATEEKSIRTEDVKADDQPTSKSKSISKKESQQSLEIFTHSKEKDTNQSRLSTVSTGKKHDRSQPKSGSKTLRSIDHSSGR